MSLHSVNLVDVLVDVHDKNQRHQLHVDHRNETIYSVMVSVTIVTTGAGVMIGLYSMSLHSVNLVDVTTGVGRAIFAMVAMVAIFFPSCSTNYSFSVRSCSPINDE